MEGGFKDEGVDSREMEHGWTVYDTHAESEMTNDIMDFLWLLNMDTIKFIVEKLANGPRQPPYVYCTIPLNLWLHTHCSEQLICTTRTSSTLPEGLYPVTLAPSARSPSVTLSTGWGDAVRIMLFPLPATVAYHTCRTKSG